MDNNFIFLAVFIFAIYFFFIRERENLEPEIPPSMSNEEKEDLLLKLSNYLTTNGMTYDNHVKFLNSSTNKSKKLLTNDSYDRLVKLIQSGGIQSKSISMYDLMSDV